MILSEILNGVDYEAIKLCNLNCEIKNLTIDSRQVVNGSMFFCIKGLHVDGHDFIKDAINHGAICIVIDNNNININDFDFDISNINLLKVKNVREALAFCSANFFGNPAKNMNLIGVTGTNGKTSTTYFIESILREAKHNVGIIGTIDSRLNGEHINIYYATATTPDSIELQKILGYMYKKKADDVVMEVSSHSLALNKVDALRFKIAIFSNLSQDHLDFHKDMKDYLKAKSILFKKTDFGIINKDDKSYDYIIKNCECEFWSYGINSDCDFKAKNIKSGVDFVSFDLDINNKTESFYINIPGDFTVYNALSAIVCAYKLNIDINIIKLALRKINNIPGRMQRVKSDRFNIIVDYAHSPDSLKNLLVSVRKFTKGKLILVFGCGGDRDKLKRPIMGKIASELADCLIITSDNPRTEEPIKIIKDIESGINKNINNIAYEKIVDRYDAIKRAIELANNNKNNNDDIILIAGKGHENYQIFADRTVHFDDIEVASGIINKIKN